METLASLAKEYRIRMILLFGSVAGGAVHPKSDRDLGVMFEENEVSLRKHAAVVHRLQELFPDREVDLAILNRADPLFLKKITERCSLLFGSERDLHSLKMYAFRRYQDHRRFLEMEKRFAREFVEKVAQVP